MIISITYQHFKAGSFTNGIMQPQLIDNFHLSCHCKPWIRSRLLAFRKERISVLEVETKPGKCLWSCCCRQAWKEPSSEELCELFLLFSVICKCSISSQLLHSHLCSELLFTGNNYSVFSLLHAAITLLPGDSLIFLITFHSKKYWEKTPKTYTWKNKLWFLCA